jgi:hypothetical protein
MRRVDWRAVVLLVTLAAVWWFSTLARGCGPLRPTEPAPVENASRI